MGNAEMRDPMRQEEEDRSSVRTIEEGFLQKRGALPFSGSFTGLTALRGWKKYWFSLHNGFLNCYQPRHRNVPGSRPVSKLALFDCQIEEYKGEKYNYSACRIITPADEELHLLAENTEEMLFWINAILKEKYLVEETINSITLH